MAYSKEALLVEEILKNDQNAFLHTRSAIFRLVEGNLNQVL